jgi:hypothetical protein
MNLLGYRYIMHDIDRALHKITFKYFTFIAKGMQFINNGISRLYDQVRLFILASTHIDGNLLKLVVSR